jgi:Polysaccharide lyase family 4, domain II
MTHFFRSGLLLALLSLPVLTATVSCSKKEATPAPVATTGSVEGTVSPVGALTTVTATNGNGITFLATPNASTGAFAFANLAPGRYNLTFTPTGGFGIPVPRAVDVVAGQTAAAGTVLVQGDGTPRGTISWAVDGGAIISTATLAGVVRPQGSATEITATASSGTVQHQVRFYFSDYISGLGTYDLFVNGPGSSSGGYSSTTGGVTVSYGTYLFQTGPTTGYAGRGTFVVTGYNAAARTMSGTFEFTAINTDNPNNVTTATITNGSFNFSY